MVIKIASVYALKTLIIHGKGFRESKTVYMSISQYLGQLCSVVYNTLQYFMYTNCGLLVFIYCQKRQLISSG